MKTKSFCAISDNLFRQITYHSFGGFFLGAGIGMAIRGGSVIDRTEVLEIYLSKKTGLTIGDIVLIFNIMIFSLVAISFTLKSPFMPY